MARRPEGTATGDAPRPPADLDTVNRSSRADWYSGFVYGTIVSLVTLSGLQFKTKPDALTSGAVVIAGGFAIMLAHTISQLVAHQSDQAQDLRLADVRRELVRALPILLAAVPGAVIMVVVELAGWPVRNGLTFANIVGVATLAVVGILTAGGAERSRVRRVFYVTWVTAAGVVVVALEVVTHHL